MTQSSSDTENTRMLVVSAGGTILKQQDGAKMKWSVSPEDLLKQAAPDLTYSLHTGYRGLAADFQVSDIIKISQIINDTESLPVLITVGTDVLEEVSFALNQFFGSTRKIVITGSMRPYGRPGYEGIRNLSDSIATLNDPSVPNGVYVVFNEQIFLGSNIHKYHSTQASAFRGDPGPVGTLISNKPNLIAYPPEQPGRDLGALRSARIDDINVPLLWSHVNSGFSALSVQNCDGLVVAAMGAGSMPTRMKDYLKEELSHTIPIVIASRCTIGPNHAELMYTGSVTKYTDHNFIIKEFETYTALQARMKLHLDLAFNTIGSYFSQSS